MPVGKLVVNAHQVRDLMSQMLCEATLNHVLDGDVTDAEIETFTAQWLSVEALCRANDTDRDTDHGYWDRVCSDVAADLFPGRHETAPIRTDWDRRLTSAFEQMFAGNGGSGLDEAGVTNLRVVLFDLRAENEHLIARLPRPAGERA